MSDKNILLIVKNSSVEQLLERGTLRPAGYRVNTVRDRQAIRAIVQGQPPDLIIMNDQLDEMDGFEIAAEILKNSPQIPIILLPIEHHEEILVRALRAGFSDYLKPPLHPDEILQAVERGLQRRQQLQNYLGPLVKKNTKSLEQRIHTLETIQRIGRKVTAQLDLDSVLTSVVDAAVELTGAEEGSLLLLDEETGELYMRAARNFQEEFVRTFRLPVEDSLAGKTLKTGKTTLINKNKPQKIKTAYLVYTLIYVPLLVQDEVIGILSVDNRKDGRAFTDYHVALVSALADYATIAIENARLYGRTEIERSKLETILTKIDEGVIVVDNEGAFMLLNRMARDILDISQENITGKRIQEVLQHPDLLEILLDRGTSAARLEIETEDGRVFNTQVTPIPEVGLAVTMQDITHLKELDRIKSDFVNAVSHDLRSPLTAILGYVELLNRVGPLNEQQKEFVQRVQVSVQSITALITDLLDLGRIESGFDARKEVIRPDAIIRFAVDGMFGRAAEKSQEISIELPENLPPVYGNSVRLQQMISNLVNNAIKYTPQGGKIRITGRSESDQIILQVIDNGPGIPQADQPYIFDKFYRGSNINLDIPGTGLGLAIVKSIVENHQGRIWVDSAAGSGAVFTVVLPVIDSEI